MRRSLQRTLFPSSSSMGNTCPCPLARPTHHLCLESYDASLAPGVVFPELAVYWNRLQESSTATAERVPNLFPHSHCHPTSPPTSSQGCLARIHRTVVSSHIAVRQTCRHETQTPTAHYSPGIDYAEPGTACPSILHKHTSLYSIEAISPRPRSHACIYRNTTLTRPQVFLSALFPAAARGTSATLSSQDFCVMNTHAQ